MKRILLATAAGLILPSLAWAADARLTYQTASGMWADAAVASLTCGVDSSGVPQICDTGGSSSSDAAALRMGVEAATSTDARIVYQTKSGMWASAIPTVPVCGVTDGIPQICTFGGGSSDLSAYLTTDAAAKTYETIAGMSSYALAKNGTLTTPAITQPSIDGGLLTTDGNGNWILSGNNGIKFGNAEWLNYNAADGYIAVNGDLKITGRVNLPTRTTGDNGNFAASTAFVQNTINAMQGSITGDLSASGSSLTLPVGSSGLNLVMSYAASGTGALTAVSAAGTLSPVDIYEVASWGTTSFKGYTLDSGTITTTATSIDSTFYLTSNAVGTYHIGVGGHLYIVDIFGSGAGKRTFMSWKEVY